MKPQHLALTFVLGAMPFSPAASASAQDVTVTTPNYYVAVEPGAQVRVPLIITNNGATPSPAVHLLLPDDDGPYTFEQGSEPDCGPIVASSLVPGWNQFEIAPLAAGATRTCSMLIVRPASAIDNTQIDWLISESNSWVYFQLGTFVDVAIAAEKVASSTEVDGTVQATFRLQAHNDGVIAIDGVVIGLGPTCVGSPITVDTNFAGGCAADSIGCGFAGGPAPAARLPVIAPNATESCLVKFTAPAGADHHVQTYLAADALINSANGGVIGDSNRANDNATLDLSPSGIASPIALPSLSPWAIAALTLALTAIASGFRRRVRH